MYRLPLFAVFAALLAVSACSGVQVDPPRKDPVLYGTPIWTP